MKRRIYKAVLTMMLKDKDELSLTGKQISQIESLIFKCETTKRLKVKWLSKRAYGRYYIFE